MILDKEEAKLFAFWMLFSFLVGMFAGWVYAHNTVASECKRLGGFYVGETNFKCTAIEQKPRHD